MSLARHDTLHAMRVTAGAATVSGGSVLTHARKLAGLLLTSGLFSLFFSTVSGLEVAVPLMAFCLIMGGGLVLLAAGDVQMLPPSGFELALLGNLAVSFVVSGLDDNAYSLQFSGLFAFILAAMVLVCRGLPLTQILRSGGRAYLAAILVFSLLEHEQVVEFFLAPAGEKWGIRYEPFGMHPNLVGFTFGAGSLLLIHEAQSKPTFVKMAYLAGSLASCVFVVAASSRAGFLAMLFGCLLIAWRAGLLKLTRFGGIAMIGLMVASVCMVLFVPAVNSFFVAVFELDSDTRGLGSGGTGRTDLWQSGIDYIFSDPARMLLGNGLRSAIEERIGFLTESSYITIGIECGLLFGSLIVGLMMLNAVRLSGYYRRTSSRSALIVFGMFAFTFFQSIFNRYLFAIGNPYSLMFLMMNITVSLRLTADGTLVPWPENPRRGLVDDRRG